jgi:hypothetical protein
VVAGDRLVQPPLDEWCDTHLGAGLAVGPGGAGGVRLDPTRWQSYGGGRQRG